MNNIISSLVPNLSMQISTYSFALCLFCSTRLHFYCELVASCRLSLQEAEHNVLRIDSGIGNKDFYSYHELIAALCKENHRTSLVFAKWQDNILHSRYIFVVEVDTLTKYFCRTKILAIEKYIFLSEALRQINVVKHTMYTTFRLSNKQYIHNMYPHLF